LRAAVLGANDGILSTSSLVIGVAAAHGSHRSVLVAGVAALFAGAMSMAAGEYVSVHSQADTEKADLALEREELRTDGVGEHKELAAIYVSRGLDPGLAKQVACNLWRTTRWPRTRVTSWEYQTLLRHVRFRRLCRQRSALPLERRCHYSP